MRESRCVLFDWGNTLMRDFPDAKGPMADWPRVETLPGVEEVLRQLRPQWTLALATNAVASDEPSVWKALARGGIAPLLDRVYCFQTIGHKKPAPAFFDYIVQGPAHGQRPHRHGRRRLPERHPRSHPLRDPQHLAEPVVR